MNRFFEETTSIACCRSSISYTSKLVQCIEFYRKLGLEYSPNPDPKKIHFAGVGEQLFGFAHEDRGFFTGYEEEFEKATLHVAFEVPYIRLMIAPPF